MPRRCSLSIALLVAAALASSTVLVGCGSSGSGSGKHDNTSEVVSLSEFALRNYAIAASPQGKVALVWEKDDGAKAELQLSELEPGSSHWSRPVIIATSVGVMATDLALSYDGLGRLLVAWSTKLDPKRYGTGWGVRAALRDRSGRWQPARLVARLPRKESEYIALAVINISSGKEGFAVSWNAEGSNAGAKTDYPNVSGFRILAGNRWSSPVMVGAGGEPLFVSLLDNQLPRVLWIDPLERKLLLASLRSDGGISKPKALARADWSLTIISHGNEIVAGWTYNYRGCAGIWNAGRWESAPCLADNTYEESNDSPIGLASSHGRVGAVWVNTSEDKGASYSVEENGRWSKPASLQPSGSTAFYVAATGLPSGELILLGTDGDSLEIAHLPTSGHPSFERENVERVSTWANVYEQLVFAMSPRVIAMVREEKDGPENDQTKHLVVWVRRF